MTPQPTNVSVALPVSLAIDRVKRVLFQPFDLGKWFTIGFCAWLAHLGEAGFRGNFNFNSSRGNRDFRQGLEQAKEFVVNNLYWIVPVAVAIFVVSLGLWVLFTWLSSRGKFMFLHCVALDKAEVVVPWDKFAREANSLFLFRIVLGLIGMVATLPLVVLAVVMGIGMFARAGLWVGGILGLIGVVLVMVAVGIVFFLIAKLTTDFVVPIMFLRGGRCLNAWRELFGLISANIGHFVLYLLFQIVLGIAISAIVLAAILVTCCCACCLMAIPYIGTVLLLPVLMFKRAYSAHYLAQFGREYDVFAVSAAPAPGIMPTAAPA
jgi:hypothetical protein